MAETDADVKKYIDEKFDLIIKAKTIEDLLKIENSSKLKKHRTNSEVYPRIDFNISRSEIEELKVQGIINADSTINHTRLKDISDPLARLFLLILWKNSDFQKIKHVNDGILNTPPASGVEDTALVFRQLGRYISGRNEEPIIDQHVVRAYAISLQKSIHIATQREMGLLTLDEAELIEKYKKWLFSSNFTSELRSCDGYTYYIDRILMALGRYAKKKKVKK
ncbi:hypothetical protein [Dyadobacter sp. 3J3]|uniref:hypothetical protein n=1 Tax=Dyadobacter sp. 3J3 TaxID=2606600 RepID=UPI00135752C7|nr:hypothetical protein [Dyadobacter sp. 3J3]